MVCAIHMFDEETKKILDSLKLHSFVEELELLDAARKADTAEKNVPQQQELLPEQEEEFVLIPRVKKKQKPLPWRKYMSCFVVGLSLCGVGAWFYADKPFESSTSDSAFIAMAEEKNDSTREVHESQDIDYQYIMAILEERDAALQKMLYSMQVVISSTADVEASYLDLTQAIVDFKEINQAYIELGS